MPARDTIAKLFGLKGEAWMRHANPASVWTRFAVLPLLALAIWSRTWIGWWCLLPIAGLIVWLVVNPLFFDQPRTTKHWVSRSVFGERIWTERDPSSLPPAFNSQVPTVAQAFQVVALVPLVYGLVTFDAIAVVCGVLLMQVAKCWYLDRMVLLFEAVKQTEDEVASWEY
jgi:hypothetical protein